MATEEAEVAALDRVLTRTVLTKDEDLQQVCVVGSSYITWLGIIMQRLGALRGSSKASMGGMNDKKQQNRRSTSDRIVQAKLGSKPLESQQPVLCSNCSLYKHACWLH